MQFSWLSSNKFSSLFFDQGHASLDKMEVFSILSPDAVILREPGSKKEKRMEKKGAGGRHCTTPSPGPPGLHLPPLLSPPNTCFLWTLRCCPMFDRSPRSFFEPTHVCAVSDKTFLNPLSPLLRLRLVMRNERLRLLLEEQCPPVDTW